MNATAVEGVWEHDTPNGFRILIDTVFNRIRITHEKFNPVSYDYDEDLKISDVVQVIESTEKIKTKANPPLIPAEV